MAKEYFCFENEEGKVSYLTGVIDTLSDVYLAPFCPRCSTVDTDVFALGENNYINFNCAIRERLMKYLPSIGRNQEKIKSLLESMTFEFEKIEGYSDFQVPGFILNTFEKMPNYEHGREQHDAISKFCEEIEAHLGKPKAYYRGSKGYNIITEFYLCIIYDIVFLEYDGYLMMMCSGSAE